MRWAAMATMWFAPALLLGGCGKDAGPARTAESDAKAIAMVEAAQNVRPPPQPLEPEPITSADIEANKLYGAGCNLIPADQPGGNPVLVANDRRALIKLGGKFIAFSADTGSAVIAMGTRTHYVGKAQSLFLERGSGDGTRLGEEASRWDGRLTVRDTWNRVVFTQSGEVVCGV